MTRDTVSGIKLYGYLCLQRCPWFRSICRSGWVWSRFL